MIQVNFIIKNQASRNVYVYGKYRLLDFEVPIWLMILSSVVMALGTSIGGYKIIKSVGMDMVKLRTPQGFAADLASALYPLLASVTGISKDTIEMRGKARRADKNDECGNRSRKEKGETGIEKGGDHEQSPLEFCGAVGKEK